jgi:hypothetical protein
MKDLTVLIPQGYQLSFTTDAFTSGAYVRLGNPGGTRYTPAAMAISTAYEVGPFNEDRNYRFDYAGTDIECVLAYNGVFDATDESELNDLDRLDLLTGTQAVTIDDIAIDASGTAIATAVNAIIAALVAAGIVAEAEEP